MSARGEGAQKLLVREFYERIWNRRDLLYADSILAENLIFRGSIGVWKRGREAFKDYVRMFVTAFPDFRCDVEELISEGDKAAAKLTFRGTHRGEILGRPASGREVAYEGLALFRIEHERIASVWVLGDVQALLDQLHE